MNTEEPQLQRGRAANLRQFAARESFLARGYVLTLNSLASAGFGFAFWVIAARRFAVEEVGFSSAAVASVAVLAGIGAVGLNSAFLRFLPRLGTAWPVLVLRGYAAAACASVVLGGVFVLVVGGLDMHLARLGAMAWALPFVGAVAVWTIFSLQDVVLITRKRSEVVLVENTTVALLRIALLFTPWLGAGARGIFIAWLMPTVAALAVINTMLARDAPKPRGWRQFPRGRIEHRGIIRYCIVALAGSAATVLLMSFMPVLVTSVAGAEANARFFLPWAVAAALQVLSTSMSAPLAVEIARGIPDERGETLRVLRHSAGVILAFAIPLLLFLPVMLEQLGSSYRVGRLLLGLLLTASLINAVSAVFLAGARARGDVFGATVAQWAAASVLIGGSWVMLNWVGLVGVGWASVAAQSVGAAIAVSRRAGHDRDGSALTATSVA